MELPARVTVMGEPPVIFEGWMIQVGKGNMSLRCPRALDVRALLKVEADDCLWLGEVIECRSEAPVWIAAVCVEHVLRGVADLTRLADRFIGTAREHEGIEQIRR